MKKILLILFLAQNLLAQKYDYNWMTGYGGPKGNEINETGISKTSFENENAKCEYLKPVFYLSITSTSMSDKDGNFLFYTNGIDIYNKNHTILKNSENFNSSKFHDAYKQGGLRINQAVIAIPHSQKKNLYYLIYLRANFDKAKPDLYITGINYSLIDINGDGGKGEMIEKNIPIFQDTLNYGNLTTVQHGNGRDWWIILFKYETNEYYRVLLSPQGFKVFPTQKTGDTLRSSLSEVCFSPDGKKFARNGLKYYGELAELDLYDFDRCSGVLSNHQRIKYNPGANKIYTSGLSISRNNRYAYTFSRIRAIQWDLLAKDISKSGDTIGYYDGYFEDGVKVLQSSFFLSQIAPDGKIYINSSNSVKSLHIIHKPNKKGALAQFQQRGYRLKSWNDALPNLPNYRLGPLDGSSCDTLGIDNVPISLFRFDQDTLNTASVEFTDLSYYEPEKWEWDFGDGSPKSYEQEPIHLFKNKNVYQVCLTVSNKYGKHTSCKKVYVGVKVASEEIELESLKIYPNPTNDYLHLEYDKEKLQDSQLIISDLQGRKVVQKTLNEDNIDVHTFPKGIYFLQILKEQKVVFREKIVVLE
jgi:Secretion system C-terminal sorting domain/PKD domain